MKVLHLFVVLALLPACGKPNDIKQLEEEAVVVANSYPGRLDAVDRRVQSIFKRGTTIPANLPGIEEVGKRLTEARDTIIQLRGIVMPGPDGKSAVEKQVAAAVKGRNADELRKLIHDTETTMDNGLRVINDDLDSVESWIALYDQGLAKEGREPTAPVAEPPAAGQASPPPAETAPPTAPNAGQGSADAKQPAQPAGHP